MDDVNRLFHALVMHLAEHDPRRLSAPFQISELYQSLIPYRLFKSELQFDSIEDYEMAILRLLAGEHGLVVLDPEDVQDVLRAETEAVAPDPGAFRDFAGALLALRADAVRGVLEENSAYAPPGTAEPDHSVTPNAPPVVEHSRPAVADFATFATDQPPIQRSRTSTPPSATDRDSLVFEAVDAPKSCPSCARALPEERVVSFCPFCGTAVAVGTCVRCGDSIEPTWQFCGTCGEPARGG